MVLSFFPVDWPSILSLTAYPYYEAYSAIRQWLILMEAWIFLFSAIAAKNINIVQSIPSILPCIIKKCYI